MLDFFDRPHLYNYLIEESIDGSKAVFSQCMKYRYVLTRQLEMPHDYDKNKGILFIMLNPSTADAFTNDPTIVRCMDFAKGWGYSKLTVVNLFAFRSPSPKEMKKQEHPCGKQNSIILNEALKQFTDVVCAWGRDGEHMDMGKRTLELADDYKTMTFRFGEKMNKNGQPKHPLYLPANTELVRHRERK